MLTIGNRGRRLQARSPAAVANDTPCTQSCVPQQPRAAALLHTSAQPPRCDAPTSPTMFDGGLTSTPRLLRARLRGNTASTSSENDDGCEEDGGVAPWHTRSGPVEIAVGVDTTEGVIARWRSTSDASTCANDADSDADECDDDDDALWSIHRPFNSMAGCDEVGGMVSHQGAWGRGRQWQS